jgi:hypothetical protein
MFTFALFCGKKTKNRRADDPLGMVVEQCATALSSKAPLPTAERCALLRAVVYLLYIIDSPRCNVFKHRTARAARAVVKVRERERERAVITHDANYLSKPAVQCILSFFLIML